MDFEHPDRIYEIVLNAFFIVQGLMLILGQLDIEWISRTFRFLDYHVGRAILALYLAGISFAHHQGHYAQQIAFFYFILVSCLYFALAIFDHEHDLRLYYGESVTKSDQASKQTPPVPESNARRMPWQKPKKPEYDIINVKECQKDS